MFHKTGHLLGQSVFEVDLNAEAVIAVVAAAAFAATVSAIALAHGQSDLNGGYA